jgi:arylsulfatase A-like enzyme
VIIVDIDTLRADHLGCYGYNRPTSPNIDAWSREAIRFEWAFAQAPNTPPSQSSIFTGLYPSTHGRISTEHLLRDEVLTLAEIMSDQGYATGAFVGGGNMSSTFGMDQGFQVYDDDGGGLAAIGPKAEQWLIDRASGRFLLLIHTFDVHAPYDRTPEPFNSAFLGEIEPPGAWFRDHMTRHMHARRASRHTANPFRLTAAQVEYARATYDGGILHVDDWFGRFWGLLRRLDLDERAIVVIISDHGEEFEEHDSVFHERLYATVTHVPWLVRLPGGHGARPIGQIVETIDLLPTLLDLTEVPVPRFLPGRSLVPLVDGSTGLSESAIGESRFYGGRIAIADHRWRLIYSRRGGATELYEYRTDPLEQADVSAAHPQEARRLLNQLWRWDFLVRAGATPAPMVEEIDPQTYEQLEALGYLDDLTGTAGAVPPGAE